MGYLHINNLYKDKTILMFKQCYALEKIHGTSAHIHFGKQVINFFSGGENHERFKALFNEQLLLEKFRETGVNDITVYGEAYGGKQQGMSLTYGKELRFIVFDVKIDKYWLNVLKAEEITKQLGLEFVPYNLIATEIEMLDTYRDSFSEQAKRLGIEAKPREGIVLRPLEEFTMNNGARVIAKYKSEIFAERQHQPKVTKDKLEVLTEANKIAEEWVTEMRLSHILDKFSNYGIENTSDIIRAMIEDISREAKDEIIENRETRKAISTKTAIMFKNKLKRTYANA
jgi:hypothetical protein